MWWKGRKEKNTKRNSSKPKKENFLKNSREKFSTCHISHKSKTIKKGTSLKGEVRWFSQPPVEHFEYISRQCHTFHLFRLHLSSIVTYKCSNWWHVFFSIVISATCRCRKWVPFSCGISPWTPCLNGCGRQWSLATSSRCCLLGTCEYSILLNNSTFEIYRFPQIPLFSIQIFSLCFLLSPRDLRCLPFSLFLLHTHPFPVSVSFRFSSIILFFLCLLNGVAWRLGSLSSSRCRPRSKDKEWRNSPRHLWGFWVEGKDNPAQVRNGGKGGDGVNFWFSSPEEESQFKY